MSQYANLIATINDAIKTNGVGAITGQLLQTILGAMVNSLGLNYQYAGIATPSTDPGTPDQNVFYIASTAGTYTNFGGLVLADGEIAILKYNGAWSKDSTEAASLEMVNQLGQYDGNPEWVRVVTDSEGKILYGVKTDGKFYFGDGCPPQVVQYVTEKLAETEGDFTTLLNAKVDKVEGKSLIDSDFASSQEAVVNTDWIQATTDSEGRIVEGVNTEGEKFIGKFDTQTEDMIKGLVEGDAPNSVISIPLLDENFISPVPVIITGQKGTASAKYDFSIPLSKDSFNIRFKFMITENLVNQNKTADFVKINDVRVVRAAGVSMSQRTTTETYNGEEKTNYWPCLVGGLRLNNSQVGGDFWERHVGKIAFSVKYTGAEEIALIENTGTSLIITMGQTAHTFSYSQYPTVSELYEALKQLEGIQVNFRGIDNRNCTELAVFSESKLKSVMYTGVDGTQHAPIVEYTDAADFMIPYAVDDVWHSVEIVKIGDSIVCSCDGIQTTPSLTIGDNTTLTLGGECDVLFKELRINRTSQDDAELVDGELISSMNPYFILFEGHGIDKMPSIETTPAGNLNTTIDRMQYVFALCKKKGYVPITIYDIAEYYAGNKPLPKRCFTLVFDGFRFANALDIDNRSVFTQFGVAPCLALEYGDIDNPETPIMHNGQSINFEKAIQICNMYGFATVSHTKTHINLKAIKPSELRETLLGDIYYGETGGVDGSILIFPWGNTSPYLFWVMNWIGYRLGIGVYPGHYYRSTLMRTRYNVTRFEIGMRENMSSVISFIK